MTYRSSSEERSYFNPCSFGMFMFFILGILYIWGYFNLKNMESSVFLIIGISFLLISVLSYPIYLFLEYKYSFPIKNKELLLGEKGLEKVLEKELEIELEKV